MLIKELYYYYKSNKLVICVLIVQITILFTLLGTFLAFSDEISYGKGNLEEIYEGKAIYHILDGYYGPGEFENFGEKEDALELLKSFYTGLNSAKSFQYLAMCNQAIEVPDSDNIFPDIEVSEYDAMKDITSFQMNKQAHDYFNLTVSAGRLFGAKDFKENKKLMPVLVGSDYSDQLAIGDKIEASYYQKEIVLEVVGILSPNTLIYYNGNPEFYLDSLIILPFIDYSTPETDDDKSFQRIDYFAKINGYISIPDNSKSATQMKLEMESIASKSGFYNYIFIGTGPDTQAYKGLINVISLNYDMVQLLFAFSFLLNIVLISFQLCLIQKRRLPSFAIHYLNGAPLSYLIKQFIFENSTIMFLSFMLSKVVLTNIFHIRTSGSFKLIIIAIIFILAISVLPIYRLRKMELISLLNSEEERL